MTSRSVRVGIAVIAVSSWLVSCDSTEPDSPELPRYEVVATVSEMVDPAVGATLTLGGATLEVPAGALAEPAEITLAETTYPLQAGAHEPLASAGQIPLSSSAFLVSSDREVALAGPLYLDLPVEDARLPEGASLSDVNVTAYSYGYLHPQGRAESVGDGTVRAPITIPRLLAGPPVGGPPRGEGVSFFSLSVATLAGHLGPLAAGTTALAVFFQPVMATLEDAPTYDEVSTEHFTVNYRDGVTEAEAMEIATELERAHAYFVGELLYSLPNLGSYFTRYQFYVADLDSWRQFLSGESARGPDGGTWAGSIVWGGSSYVNATKTQPERISTAMHEYFHAVQWGATNRLAPNSLATTLDPQGLWLIEGSATAMAGRMIRGGGTAPARDISQTGSIERETSIFDPTGHHPAPDVAQDFFVFLERRLGDATFYREMIEHVTDDGPGGTVEPSVVAVDDVLLARSGDTSGLSAAWTDFMREFLWNAPGDYGGVTPETTDLGVRSDGSEQTNEITLPPLSYTVQDFLIPRYADDTPEAEQRSTLQLDITVSGDSVLQVDVQVGTPGGTPMQVEIPRAGETLTVILPDVRGTDFTHVWVTSTNPLLANDDVVRVHVRATLEHAEDTPLPAYPTAPPDVPACPPSIALPEIPDASMPGEVREPAGAWALVPEPENEPVLAPTRPENYFWQVCSYASPTGVVRDLRFQRYWQPYDVTLYEISGGTVPDLGLGATPCTSDPALNHGSGRVARISGTHLVVVTEGYTSPLLGCIGCPFEDAFRAAHDAHIRQLEAFAVSCP